MYSQRLTRLGSGILESSRVVCEPFLAALAWDRNVVLFEWRHHDGNIQQFICGNPFYAMGALAKHLEPFAHFSTNTLIIPFVYSLFHPGQLDIIGFKIGRRIEALVECEGIGNLVSPRALLTDGGPAHKQTQGTSSTENKEQFFQLRFCSHGTLPSDFEFFS